MMEGNGTRKVRGAFRAAALAAPALALLLLAAGCAATSPPPGGRPAATAGPPAWVAGGSGFYGGEAGRYFAGVGTAAGGAGPERADTEAEAAARRDVEALLVLFFSPVDDPGTVDPARLASVRHRLRTFPGDDRLVIRDLVRVADRWTDPSTGARSVRAVLDLGAMSRRIAGRETFGAEGTSMLLDRIRGDADRHLAAWEAYRRSAGVPDPGGR